MRAVNLIPENERRGERAPLRSGPLAYMVVGVLLLGFVGVYALVTTGNSISENEAHVTVLEQELQSSTARAAALQSFSEFASLEESRTETVASLAQSRFDWERVLRELAFVIPADVTLDSLSGSVSGGDGDGGDSSSASAAGSIEAPTLTMSGCAEGHESVARLVAALRDVDGVTRVGLGSTSESGQSSDSSAAASTSEATTGGSSGCGPKSAVFDLTIAFDEVAVDPEGGGIAPPADSTSATTDGSGVAEAQAERRAAQGSVEDAEERSSEAVDRYVPGA